MINTTKLWLCSVFETKDMSEARYVQGEKIVRNHPKKLLGMYQEAYIKRVLERFQTHYSKPVDNPVEKGMILNRDQCPKIYQEKEKMKDVPYASAVGSLNIRHVMYTT